MRRFAQKFSWLLGLVFWILLMAQPTRTQAQQTEVSFQIFYDELAPYGRWMLHPKYGDVWAPELQGEFTPYLTNGYWTVTQYGNTWVSNYDWGWAPFHYGRWFFDEFEGWIWIPDTTWAPAWVVWRNGGGYYGWAPMQPGLNVSISFNVFNDMPSFYWNFVPQQYVWRPFVYRYCSPRHRNVYIVNNTTYVTHYHGNTYNYYSGPSHTEITQVTRRPVVVNQVVSYDRPGRAHIERDKIALYKPTVNRSADAKPIRRGNYNVNNGWHQEGKRPARGTSNGREQANANDHGNGDQDVPGNSSGNNNGENSEKSNQGNSGNDNGGRWSTEYRKPTEQQSNSGWDNSDKPTTSERTARPAPMKRSESNSTSSWSAPRTKQPERSSGNMQRSTPTFKSSQTTRQQSTGSSVHRSNSGNTGRPVVNKPTVTRAPSSSTPRSVPSRSATPSPGSGGSSKGKTRE